MKIILRRPLWFAVITTLCLVVVALFVASGCNKSETLLTNENNILQGSKWHLVGIGGLDKIDLQELEPKDCKECYTLTFDTRSTVTTYSSANKSSGFYTVDYKENSIRFFDLTGTELGERGDGILYVNTLNKINSFSLQESELKLYYNEKKNYLLFKSFCDNDKPQETCQCVMDTLKGEWSWIKTYGGFLGNTTDNEFKSVIKILNQNEDASINYEVFVNDTLFYRGNFQIQEDQKNSRTANIKLPHEVWRDNITWQVYFFNIIEMEYNETIGNFEHNPSKDTLTLWDGAMDGYNYIYKKIK